jgi:quinol monooxygenase YgiN
MEAVLASGEPGTVSWCAAKDEGEPGVYVIFDTFNDEAGRDAHLAGEAGTELAANAEKLFPWLLRFIGFRWSPRSKALGRRFVVRQMPLDRESR